MSMRQLLITAFAVLGIGICLPLGYGLRMALILAFTVLGGVTLISGGLHYVLGAFH